MTTYQRTLKSSRWQILKWRSIVRAEFSCQRCNRKFYGRKPQAMRFFELHHRHYSTVGREAFEDVEVLCPPCHRKHHGTC